MTWGNSRLEIRRFSRTYDTPRGSAQIVLEDPPGSAWIADQIDAGDDDASPVGERDTAQHRVIARRAGDELGRYDAVGNDALVAVDIVEKAIERPDALLQTAPEVVEVIGRNQPGNDAVGKDLFGTARVAIHRERHAAAEDQAPFQIEPGVVRPVVARGRFLTHGRGDHGRNGVTNRDGDHCRRRLKWFRVDYRCSCPNNQIAAINIASIRAVAPQIFFSPYL